MRIEEEIKLDFCDVLIRPKRSMIRSRSEVDLVRKFSFKHSSRNWSGIPLIAANMDHTGTFEMAKAFSPHQALTAIDKFETPQRWQQFAELHPSWLDYCFMTLGMQTGDLDKLQWVLKNIPSISMFCLDVANGYTQHFVDFIKRVRDLCPHHVIMAGNVVTAEMSEELIISGADIVKVGIGPGSVCTTRKKTGVGYPQLSCIIECADAVHGLGGLLCSDGGCVVAGDVVKAFAAGADFVMLGGMLAGHEECSGDQFEKNGKCYKRFYGMSSSEAMQKHHGHIAPYRSAEGKSVDVPYKGPVTPALLDILGGLRSACTYVGSQKLKELSKRTTFVRVHQQLNNIFTPFETDPS